MIFLDANVLLDLIEPGQRWHDWSLRTVADAAADGMATNHIVIAEAASSFATAGDVSRLLRDLGIALTSMTVDGALAAGRAHRLYRRNGGGREAVLADFLIAGHASALNAVFVTRDRRRFATYFPGLMLITPETHP